MLAELSRHVLYPLAERSFFGEQQPVRPAKIVDHVAGKPAALQADDIKT